MRQFKGIIFDPDLNSRTRLKSATIPVSYFDTVYHCGTERETLTWIDRQDQIDIIFISERIDPDTIERFIDKVKDSAKGIECIFILVKVSPSGGLPVSEALSRGIDGILCEPFSVDNLTEVVELAERIGHEREEVRAKISMTLLVTDMVNQIDAAAYLVRNGCNPRALFKSLKNLSDRACEIPDERLEVYFDIVFRLVSSTAPMNKELATKIYRGASERVRRNTEFRVWREIASLRPDTRK